jgi:hypothetical protein
MAPAACKGFVKTGAVVVWLGAGAVDEIGDAARQQSRRNQKGEERVHHRIAHTGRLAWAGALVTLAFAALAYAGGVAPTGSAGPASADQYQPKKITICHHARGKKGTKHVTIRINRSAWRAHQRHGDTLGRLLDGVEQARPQGQGARGEVPQAREGTGQEALTGRLEHGRSLTRVRPCSRVFSWLRSRHSARRATSSG